MKKTLVVALATVAVSASHAFVFSTGFETVEGFTVGAINGQNGFTTFNAAANAPIVSDANPNGGNQHLRLPDDPAVGNGTLNGVFSPDFTAQVGSDDFFDLSFDLSITDVGGADYDIVGQTPGQANLSFRLKFNFEGNIFVLDDNNGTIEYVDTGIAWATDEYKRVSIQTNLQTDTIDYFYDGALIHSGVNISPGFGTTQFVMFSDSWHLADEFGDIDNVTLTTRAVPEPATMTLLGLGALVALRRKAKKA